MRMSGEVNESVQVIRFLTVIFTAFLVFTRTLDLEKSKNDLDLFAPTYSHVIRHQSRLKDEPYDHWLRARTEPELQKPVDYCKSKIMPFLKVALVGNKTVIFGNIGWIFTHLPEKQGIILSCSKFHHYHCFHVGLVGKNL